MSDFRALSNYRAGALTQATGNAALILDTTSAILISPSTSPTAKDDMWRNE